MKKIILFAITLFVVSLINIYSQDKVFLRKDTMDAKVIEIGMHSIRYQKANDPIRQAMIHDVLRIEYSDGDVDDYGSKNPRKIMPKNHSLYIASFLTEEILLAEMEMTYFMKPYMAHSMSTGIDTEKNVHISAGPRHFINRVESQRKLVPYMGFQLGTVFNIENIKTAKFLIMLPAGIDYIFDNGFNLALQFSPRFTPKTEDSYYTLGLKIGKNF